MLDLDGDGAITTGDDVLGIPAGAPRRWKPLAGENSFTLLAAYDDPSRGGNGDGVISAADAVFGRLRLWIDANHDGVSQPEELVSLATAGITSIDLSYRATGRRDGLGNFYRYRGTAHLQSGRTAPIWDVWLSTRSASGPTSCSRPQPVPSGPMSESAADADEALAVDTSTIGSVTGRSEDLDPPPASERVEYYHLDTLGSVRVVTDEQGHVVARHDFLPFGEEWFGAAGGPGTNPVDKRLFTGHERDAELGLDYFGARYYRADVGRFTTGDPAAKLEEYVPNPQRWNRYAYVTNNPLNYTDPDGRDLRWAASVSSQDKKQLTEMLVRVTMKEEGLRALTQIDESRTVFEIQAGQLPSGSEGGHPVAVLGTIDFNAVPVAITIDTQKISSITPSSDPVHAGGMVTMAHELQHALSFVTAPDNGTSKLLPVAAGDLPTSQTGPAEKWAVGLFKSKDVIKRRDAEALVKNLMESK